MILKIFSVRNMAEQKIKKIFPAPPIIGTYFEYIDVNKNEDLRKKVTAFFHKKVMKWTSSYKEFSHLKPYSKKINSNDGYTIIYNLIRYFCNYYNINWYDLKDHYIIFKDFLRVKLADYLK